MKLHGSPFKRINEDVRDGESHANVGLFVCFFLSSFFLLCSFFLSNVYVWLRFFQHGRSHPLIEDKDWISGKPVTLSNASPSPSPKCRKDKKGKCFKNKNRQIFRFYDYSNPLRTVTPFNTQRGKDLMNFLTFKGMLCSLRS